MIKDSESLAGASLKDPLLGLFVGASYRLLPESTKYFISLLSVARQVVIPLIAEETILVKMRTIVRTAPMINRIGLFYDSSSRGTSSTVTFQAKKHLPNIIKTKTNIL